MRVRALALSALCVVVSGAALTAEAAPKKKPACNLVTDAKGDATQFVDPDVNFAPNEPALDIVSADIASNGKEMTTVVRVDKLARNSPGSPYGNIWWLEFTVGGTVFFTQAQSPLTGDVFRVGYRRADDGVRQNLADGTAIGVLDLVKNEVRVTFELEQLASQARVKRGAKITGLFGLTNRSAQVLIPQSDEASDGKSYVEGSPSCVAVGK